MKEGAKIQTSVVMANNGVFSELRRRLRILIRRKRKNYVSPRFDTSDIVQESMLQLIDEVAERGDEPIGNGLLEKVASGHLAKQLRYHNAAKRSVGKEEVRTDFHAQNLNVENPCEVSIRSELTEKALNGLAELDDLPRQIVTRRFFQDATYEQIAEQLNVSVYVVKTQLKTALQYLNSQIGSE